MSEREIPEAASTSRACAAAWTAPAAAATGRASRSWRDTPGFQEFLHREFPENASEWTDPEGRREFLTLMGASLALAGLTACTRQPDEKIVPYVKRPRGDRARAGRSSSPPRCSDGGYAKGVLVESHMGRPTKIEGNPDHPGEPGRDRRLQRRPRSSSLYDPDRSQTVTHLGEIRAWGAFAGRAARPRSTRRRPRGGAGLRILTETVTSPTLAAQIERAPAGAARRRAGTSTSRRPRQRARGRRARVRRAGRGALPPRRGRRDPVARRRLPRVRARAACALTREFAQRPQARRRRREA